MSEKSKIILSFSSSILVLLLVAAFSIVNINKYKESSAWVNHTQEVISQTQQAVSHLQGIETVQRGYIITGNLGYLDALPANYTRLEATLTTLKKLTADNPVQRSLLDSVIRAYRQKIGFVQSIIALRKIQGFEQAKEIIAEGKGDVAMQEFQASANRFIANEKSLLAQRLQKRQKDFGVVIVIIILSAVISVVIILLALVYFIRDYNKRVFYQKKLKQSETRLTNILDALPVGVYIVDTAGKAYYANSVAGTILASKITEEHVIENLPELYKVYRAGTNELYPASELPVAKALSGTPSLGVDDIEIAHPDRRMPLRVNAIPLRDSDGAVEYAIAVFEDISFIKEAQQEIIEARKIAEESLMLKEAFLANMSHEIRTPMNAILGFTDLLLAGTLNAEQRDYVETIKTSGDNLLRIINDILDISKIDAKMMTFEEHDLSIREMFRSLHTMLAQKAREKNIQLQFNCGDTVPEIVLGDPTRLTQVIINLTGNAIKFTREGSVTVNASVEDVTGDYYKIKFTVKDTGIGIADDKLQGIFQRFSQAENFTTRNYGGTGLGLSIAKQLVELQGGTIEVKSVLGIGSVFSFVLTFQISKGNSSKKQRDSGIDFNLEELQQLSILVAEDNPINVKLLVSLFAHNGIKADFVENGKLVLEKLVSGHSYDMILMDMEMPELNGYDTTVHIRTKMQNKIPIIAMTAHAMAGEREKCLSLGMNDYIPKPLNTSLLFKMMNSQAKGAKTGLTKPLEETPVINLDYLKEFSGGHKGFEREMIELLLQQIPENIEQLREAYEAREPEAIRQIAHKIKSSVAMLGSPELIPLLTKIEHQSTPETFSENIKTDIDLVTRILEQCYPELKRILTTDY
jgi:signal transduction histidine kinase/DNA-binding NarL/FixJ family response regulator